MQAHCFTQRLGPEILLALDESVARRPVARGHYAFHVNDPFNALFFIHTGFLKQVVRNEQGQEFIAGFPMPGDVLGLDGCADGYFSSQALALQDSVLCAIPFQSLQDLSRSYPTLQDSLYRIMSREIARRQQSMAMLGNLSAEQRLLAFLNELSRQFVERGISTSDFELPMTREDIAGYLGLQMETVSRAFSKLHAEGSIHVHRRHVRIDALNAA